MASQLGQGGLACCSPRGRDQASGPMCVDQSDLSVKASLDASSLRFPLLRWGPTATIPISGSLSSNYPLPCVYQVMEFRRCPDCRVRVCDITDALIDILCHHYPIASNDSCFLERSSEALKLHLVCSCVLLWVDPDDMAQDLVVFYEEIEGKQNLRAALGSWVVHEQIRVGRRVGWVPRADLLRLWCKEKVRCSRLVSHLVPWSTETTGDAWGEAGRLVSPHGCISKSNKNCHPAIVAPAHQYT